MPLAVAPSPLPSPAAAPAAPPAFPPVGCNIPTDANAPIPGKPDRLHLSPELLARVSQATNDAVAGARAFYAKYGFTDAQGNGPLKTVIEPGDAWDASGHFHNASYDPLADEMLVGHPPWSTSWGFSPDVIAHEYSHRILEKLVPLVAGGESGTVAESLADTFAEAIAGNDDWTIGENTLRGGLRSMLHPDRQEDAQVVNRSTGEKRTLPATVADAVDAATNADVHINVGIPNRAAALIGTKLGRPAMADIYMSALRDHLQSDVVATPDHPRGTNVLTFAGLAQSTIDAARALYGEGPSLQAVRDAWQAVGLDAPAIAAGVEQQHHAAERWQRMIES